MLKKAYFRVESWNKFTASNVLRRAYYIRKAQRKNVAAAQTRTNLRRRHSQGTLFQSAQVPSNDGHRWSRSLRQQKSSEPNLSVAQRLRRSQIHQPRKKPLQHHRKRKHFRGSNALQQFLRIRRRQGPARQKRPEIPHLAVVRFRRRR